MGVVCQEVVVEGDEGMLAVFQALKGIAHLFGGDEVVTLHDFLIMFCNGDTQLVERTIDIACRYAFANGSSAFDAPEFCFDGYLAAELCLCAVHGDAPHDGRGAVFLDLVLL